MLHTEPAPCTVCGKLDQFRVNPAVPSIRENYRCSHCAASLRYREQARVILDFYSRRESVSISALVEEDEFSELRIYEPGLIGPFRKYLSTLQHYVKSYLWCHIPPGTFHNGIQCQDIMRLTYSDNSFDLVITSDIFEHVRRPFMGFQEVNRVLKPGGMHVFTIPVQHPLRTRTVFRVDTSGDQDILLMPPHYHGASEGPQSLVYTDFGSDLQSLLKDYSIDLHLDPPSWSGKRDSALDKMITLYWIKQC